MAEEDIKKAARAAEEAVTYPILTSNAGYSQAGAMPGNASLGAVAENAIRQVLGWRPRNDDPKAFVAALTQSFELVEQGGYTVAKFTPRGYAVQAELGAITGAQASLFKRAKDTVDRSLKLLDGLVPLRVEADEELRSSTTSLIRQALQGLVNEFGTLGGPRVQRADSLFDLLLGSGPNKPAGALDVRRSHGYLGQLRERFGFKRRRVNTIEEEQNLTNFLVLADDVIGLARMWADAKPLLLDGKFLGTLMVKLSRQLDVLAESIREAYAAMDSVFLGEAERQVIELDFHQKLYVPNPGAFAMFQNEPKLTIAELLEWVDTFATHEGKHMIEDAGKDGVVAFASIARRLSILVRGAKEICKGPSDNPTRAFHTSRVLNVFDELKAHLTKASDLANGINATTDNQPVSDVGAAKGTLREFRRDNFQFLNEAGPQGVIRAQAEAVTRDQFVPINDPRDRIGRRVNKVLNQRLPRINNTIDQRFTEIEADLEQDLARLIPPRIQSVNLDAGELILVGHGLLNAELHLEGPTQPVLLHTNSIDNETLRVRLDLTTVVLDKPYAIYVVGSNGLQSRRLFKTLADIVQGALI